jgi:V-type H+-transporting ATPase subunit a
LTKADASDSGPNSYYAYREVDATTKEAECVYPFGIDPIWYRAEQTISILNSFKMKLSVILGVSQMILGILMKGLNAIYFKRWSEFVFEFIT